MPDTLPDEIVAREKGYGSAIRHIFLCTGKACADSGHNLELWNRLKNMTAEWNTANPDRQILRTKADCLRLCQNGGVAVVYPEGTLYSRIDGQALDRITEDHLIGGKIVSAHAVISGI